MFALEFGKWFGNFYTMVNWRDRAQLVRGGPRRVKE